MTVLQENGKTSSIRVAMFIAVITGCIVAVIGVWRGVDLFGLTTLSTGLVSAGMGFKAYQKGGEK